MQVIAGSLSRHGQEGREGRRRWGNLSALAGATLGNLGTLARSLAVIRGDQPPQTPATDHWSARRTAHNPAPAPDAPTSGAFDQFYQRHEQPLYGYLRRLLPTHEAAVEIAQEAFFRAWREFARVDAYDKPEAWLYRVATNLAISSLRRRAPLSFSTLFARTPDADSEREAHGDPLAGDVFTAQIAAPLDIERQAAERDVIERALRALPARQRAALLLAAVQGFSSDEIAAMLGVSPANARQLVSRGRDRFRRLYDAAQHA